MPILAGADFGTELCDTGFVHRATQHVCPPPVSGPSTCQPFGAGAPLIDSGAACTNDLDCTAQPYGVCTAQDRYTGVPLGSCQCAYRGCASDADCGAGSVCLCGLPVGICVPGSCTSDADCPKGLLCTMSTSTATCPQGVPFTCQTPEDTCGGDKDCPANQACGFQGGRHQCVPSCAL